MMPAEPPHGLDQDLLEPLTREGFAFARGAHIRDLLERTGSLHDWPGFADSWNRLEPDTYLAETGRARRRRHGVFGAGRSGPATLQPPQPHYQRLDHNRLQGDIDRWFAPIEDASAASTSLQTVMRFGREQFSALAPPVTQWRIEVHQFRIEAHAGKPGEPTPEGVHRDGVDYVLVLMIDRRNIASGTTTIHRPDGSALGSFTLAAPFDAALVDDHRVLHGVTPVSALDTDRPAYRDVLVVTYQAA